MEVLMSSFCKGSFYQGGVSVYSRNNFFKVSFKVWVLPSGIPLSQYMGSTNGFIVAQGVSKVKVLFVVESFQYVSVDSHKSYGSFTFYK